VPSEPPPDKKVFLSWIRGTLKQCHFHFPDLIEPDLIEFELELTQIQMTRKPMLGRRQKCVRVRCKKQVEIATR